MSAGRPRKWSGYYKRLEIRIPHEYSTIVDMLSSLSESSDKSINEIILEILAESLPIYISNNQLLLQNSMNIRIQAKEMFLKLQIKDIFKNYQWEIENIINRYHNSKSDIFELYDNYRYLQQYRTAALKLISKLPIIDDDIKEIYNQLVNLPEEVKQLCEKLEK